ncbi:helix-turn-helix transcriptional regulator [Pseudonocardia endophytica]|uniref:LuxR family transcriptional regulator n=1 Tax=Pseudonocardia endophytica TaxID=401976 RepID=A0A4R1HLZ9_PSEEN|nr:LuxR C-terminal-related transcriptional regulator [Pseudonocardia endophytica]TCK23018.1 LuxR family transcriptional regulator [Pseudonocardia endophytica]
MDVRTSAPAAVAGMVGRTDDLVRLCRATGRERLVTVTGPGGCGKTRLVFEAVSTGGAGGVVELAGTGPHADPAAAVLAACGFREEPGRAAVDVLCDRLARAPRTVVLDNCEHLRGAVAALVAELLGRCAELRVVATSRVPLGVPGEVVLTLSGLDPAGDGADLFLERARRVQPSLPDDGPTRATAVAISEMADGLPLAIELAAAHARSLPLDGIRDGMADRLRFLRARNGTTAGRHSSLLSSLDWSAELVGAPARSALCALALLDGRFELDAALAATGDREALEALVDHCLVRFDAADGRYLLLDTVRAYGLDGLDDAGRRHALDGLLAWAARLAGDVRAGLERADPDALRRVDRADAALCSVLDRSLETGVGRDVAAAIATDMAFGWSLRGRCAEGLSRTTRLVATLDPVPPGLAWAHGFLALYAGDVDTGLAFSEQAVRTGGDRVRARALIVLGMVQAFVDPAGAEPVLADAEAAAAAAGDDWGQVEAAQIRAYTHVHRSSGAAALRCADGVLPVLERMGHGQLAAWDAAIRADVAEAAGRYPEALREGYRGLEAATTVGEPVSAAGSWIPLLRALVAVGDVEQAGRVLDDGLRFFDAHPGLGIDGFVSIGTALVASAGPAAEAVDAAAAAAQCPGMVPVGAAEVGLLLGVARLRSGDPCGARRAAAEAADAARSLGHRGFVAVADMVVAAAARAEGGTVPLSVFDLLGSIHDVGLRPLVPDALDLVAALHRDAGRDPAAARLHAAATHLRAALGVVASPLARTLAPPPEWSAAPELAGARAEGARFGEAGAVGYARRARGRRGRPRAGWDSLTPTERDVVALVATGRSNAEIGASLLVSPGTVRTHLRSVFAKLGVTSRTELAARAAQAGS